jgi:hypothetical protein
VRRRLATSESISATDAPQLDDRGGGSLRSTLFVADASLARKAVAMPPLMRLRVARSFTSARAASLAVAC